MPAKIILPKETTSVRPCTCIHVFQDKQYGRGQRVHNFALKAKEGSAKGAWRCSVCKKCQPA